MKEIPIRGHHLEAFEKYLVDIDREGLSNTERAWNLVNNLASGVEMVSGVKGVAYEGRTYEQDIFGLDRGDTFGVRSKLYDIGLLILIGDDDTQVKFVADESDVMCQACVFGVHCRTHNIEEERKVVQQYFPDMDIGSVTTLGELREKLGLVHS